MINILNRDFAQLPYQAFVPKVEFILAQLTGNAYFPSTLPKLSDIQVQLDLLTNALTLPDPQALEVAAAAARTTLEQMLDDLADNLELTANMDPVKLATTGFEMHKTPTQSSEAPEIPQNLRLKATGVTGEAQILLDAAARARGYEVQTAPDPMAGPWTFYDSFSSSRGIVLKGFPRAKDLWARVRALGPNNTKSGWSDPATILINERRRPFPSGGARFRAGLPARPRAPRGEVRCETAGASVSSRSVGWRWSSGGERIIARRSSRPRLRGRAGELPAAPTVMLAQTSQGACEQGGGPFAVAVANRQL